MRDNCEGVGWSQKMKLITSTLTHAHDPNHALGSSCHGRRTGFHFCTCVVLEFDDIQPVVNALKKGDNLSFEGGSFTKTQVKTDEKYGQKYLKAFKALQSDKEYWEGVYAEHGNVELAYKNPQIVTDATKIKYTASYPAGLITLDEATEQRTRPWSCWRNKAKHDSLPEENSLPNLYETCGVLIKGPKNILVFDSIKFCSKNCVPGGSVEWDDESLGMEDKTAHIVANALREFEEEVGYKIVLDQPIASMVMNGATLERTRDYLRAMSTPEKKPSAVPCVAPKKRPAEKSPEEKAPKIRRSITV